MRPRAQTLIERLGFQDPDRKSNKHDEIQLWTYNHIDEVLKSLSSPGKKFDIHYKALEYPIKLAWNSSTIVGYVDLFVSGFIIGGQDEPKRFAAAFEIKSEIRCFGDLVRQINFYRQYDYCGSTWIVISPDERYRTILREQGIFFIRYKSPNELF
jgi:hypothetical protein